MPNRKYAPRDRSVYREDYRSTFTPDSVRPKPKQDRFLEHDAFGPKQDDEPPKTKSPKRQSFFDEWSDI